MRGTVIGILFLFLFTACAERSRKTESPVAQSAAETVRDGWKKSCRPLAVCLEGRNGEPPALPYVCVYAAPGDATSEERKALCGVRFPRNGGHYESPDREAVTSDTLVPAYVYYPYRQGIDADNAVTLEAPFSENMYGTEKGRSIGDKIMLRTEMRSAMALLRIHVESDDLHDMLDGISIVGEHIYTTGNYKAVKGLWGEVRSSGFINYETDCVLNNGQAHDFYLIPTAVSGMLTVIVSINKSEMALKTTLPPMCAGSLTQLNLRKSGRELTVSSSWVETERTLAAPTEETPDSVCVGHYLQADGRISAHKDSKSVAVVIESDGKHGKAAGIRDCQGEYTFASASISSGTLFPTIDGDRKEGVLNPNKDSSVAPDCRVIFKPGMPYGKECALGYSDGAKLTSILRNKNIPDKGNLQGKDMLSQVSSHPASYVPSLAEMSSLYYQLHNSDSHLDIEAPAEEYLTSSEATASTAYIIDMTHGIITGNVSKRYFRGKLRLFYLF